MTRHLTTLNAVAFSEDALAARFIELHGGDWRYIAVTDQWLRWQPPIWAADTTGSLREAVRQVCRGVAQGCNGPLARRLCSDRTIVAVIQIISADPAIAATEQEFDVNPMHLATRDAVIDLETGEALPSGSQPKLTQIVAARVGNHCPRWLAFLREITNGDIELQAYIQRLFGYCATGSMREQVFFFFLGQGANGKSVMLQVISKILNNYVAFAALDTFAETRNPRHLSELAGLRRARLVIVPETSAGQTLAEARIKAITGGEVFRVNHMHRDHFEYAPRFKVIMAGNHLPRMRGVGEAMRRRVHVIPFTVTIPPERRDPNLVEALLAEGDGILGWIVAGALAWRMQGLAPPACVRAAAEGYLEREDVVGQWLDEVADICSNGRETSAALFASWRTWAEQHGHLPRSACTLGEALASRGFRSGKVGRARGWLGLRLRDRPKDTGGSP